MGNIKHSQLLFTASVLAISALCPPARAQQIVADGVTVDVPAGTVIDMQAAGTPAGSALVARNGGTINTLGQVNLTTRGVQAHAVFSFLGGTVNLNGGVVTTIGDRSVGLFANSGTLTSSGNLTIGTSGNTSAHGINAAAASTVLLNGRVYITTTGLLSAGLLADTSTVTSNGPLIIKTSGNNNARGIIAQTASTVTLKGSVDIETTGDQSTGLISAGSKVTASGPLTIRTAGAQSYGIGVRNGSTVEIAKGDIVTEGAAAAGIQTLFSGANRVSTVSVANGRLESAQGDLVRSDGGALDVTLDTMTTRNGSGLVLNVLDNAAGNHGVVNFKAINTGLTGDIFAAADNIANVSLVGSELTGAAYNATNISLDAGSVWTITDSSTVSDTVTNAGTIAFAAADAGIFKTLTTTNYSGDNGTVVLNTSLGADASPSDQLVINGGVATGRTGLVINNVAGTGAPTTDGIKVVDAINGGTTNADAFFLNGDYVTDDGQNAKVGGAYAYTLHYSPVSSGSDVYGDSYAANDWYLRSVTASGLPRYHPGVPVYETYPATLQILNRLPSLSQRTGDRYWREQAPATYSQDGATIATGNNVWGRIEGLHGHQQPDGTTSRSDYDYDLWRLQAGIDGQLYESDAGQLIGGVTVHYGQVNTDVSSVFGHGGIDTAGYGFGGTLTWYGNNGFYLDAQGQLTWFDSDVSSNTLRRGLADSNDGFGYAFSLEAGQRIGLNENWTLTPQAQLSWSSVDFDSFTDPYGARVSLDRGDSLEGRLGLALGHERSWQDADGQTSRMQVYGIVNLTNEFLDGTRVDVSGTKFDSRTDRLTGGIGLGGTYSWANDKYAIYGEVSADTSLKNFADSYEVGGKLGLRVRF